MTKVGLEDVASPRSARDLLQELARSIDLRGPKAASTRRLLAREAATLLQQTSRPWEALAAANDIYGEEAERVRGKPKPPITEDEDDAEDYKRRAGEHSSAAHELRREARSIHDCWLKDNPGSAFDPCFFLPKTTYNTLHELASLLNGIADFFDVLASRDYHRAGGEE